MLDAEDSFKNYVMDHLQFLADLRYRPMFGGFGLYDRSHFFGIIHRGRLFFKTNVKTQVDYVALGMEPFQPNAKQRLKKYYEVPPEILEDQEVLARWARKAISCAEDSSGPSPSNKA